MEMMKLIRKKKVAAPHVCKRFKTVRKRNGIREIVACRVCGNQRDLTVMPE